MGLSSFKFSWFIICVPQFFERWCVCVAGNETVDSVCVVLLSTSMFVGGFIGFVMDNVIPGEHCFVFPSNQV